MTVPNSSGITWAKIIGAVMASTPFGSGRARGKQEGESPPYPACPASQPSMACLRVRPQ